LLAALQAPAPAPPPAPWTFLIYGAADNNADGHMFGFIRDVRAALAAQPGVEVALFMDRHTKYSDEAETLGEDFTGARLYRLTGGGAERLDGGPELPLARLDAEWEADSGDPAVLGSFVRWGKRRFPARHTALLIYSHADGITMCPDEGDKSEMDLADFAARAGAGSDVDWTGLELCNMGSFEVAYSWRPGSGGFSTGVLVAIPNAGPPLDWARILARFEPELSPLDLGRIAIEEGGRGRLADIMENPQMAAESRESVSCYDLSRIGEAKSAWDRFAVALAAAPGAEAVLGGLRDEGEHPAVLNYVDDGFRGEHAFVDASALARRAEEAEELPEPARAAARAAREALDAAIVDSFAVGFYKGFVAGENGIFVTFPDGAFKPGSLLGRAIVWSKYPWYAHCPFARDGATPGDGKVTNWFELLDLWFDEGDAGGVNGVAP
jgi:hypothetical protein